MKKILFLFSAALLLTSQALAQYSRCDVNQDGKINTADVVTVYNAIINGDSGPVEPIVEPKIYTVNGISFNMIAVEGGTFQMGATSEQDSEALDNEKPVHQVTISDFSIGQTEVTQELWQAVMGFTPIASSYQWNSTDGLGDKLPAYYINYSDCQEFIQKLNELTGQKFRLPTEAEWEFAARGGNKSKGYKFSGSNTLSDVAWYQNNSSDQNQEVATKSPNELGIYDMSGSVWEWCSDWFGEYQSTAQTNPTGPETGTKRVYRGGCWGNAANFCRVSIRAYFSASYRASYIGLRLAL